MWGFFRTFNWQKESEENLGSLPEMHLKIRENDNMSL